MSDLCPHNLQIRFCHQCLASLAREAAGAYEHLVYEMAGIGQEVPLCRFCETEHRDHAENCPHGKRLDKFYAAGLLPASHEEVRPTGSQRSPSANLEG